MTEQFPGLTKTQNRLFGILRDGRPHQRSDLHNELSDELQASNGLSVHISNMRKVLRAKGLDIVCRTFGSHRPPHYQLVCLYLPDE